MTRKPFSKMTDTIEVRIAPESKLSFVERCEKGGKSASEVLRVLMEDYVAAANRAPDSQSKEFAMFRILASRPARFAMVAASVAAVGIVSVPSVAKDERIEAAFLWIDADGSRFITPEEMFAERKDAPLATGSELSLTTKDGHVPGETPQDLFDRMDADGDGRISLAELESTVDVSTRLDPTILDADQNGDAAVSPIELAAHIAARRAEAGDARPAAGVALMAEGLLHAHDADGDGVLTRSDLAGQQG